MTLKELSRSTGLSEAYLSRVENGKSVISISGLGKVAEALGVGMGTFFEASEAAAPLIIRRAGEGKKIRFRTRQGIKARLLADGKKDKLMEPLWLDVSSLKTPMPLKGHSGQEFIYIISGTCRFRYAQQELELNEGDSIYFDASIDHGLVAIPGTAAEAVSVVTSREYHFHGNIDKLIDK